MKKLAALGLRPATEQAFDEATKTLRAAAPRLGRVMRVERGFATIVTEEEEDSFHVPKGMVRVLAGQRDVEQTPVTGDWVVVDATKRAVLRVLPRASQFVRRAAGKREAMQVVASNVDVLFVLMGLDGDFNIRRLERYLTLASESGATPVVLLTKAGLGADVETRVHEVEGAARGIAVHAIDVVSGIDPNAALAYLKPGVTAALIGSSGVGKSTLANYLMKDSVARVGEVRAHDERGKHTTSRRETFLLEGGAIIIDTPGMRELALWGETTSLEGSFPDIVELAATCRFTDCNHGTEPGCAVRAALESGDLDPSRVASFKNLAAELGEREKRSSRPPRSRR